METQSRNSSQRRTVRSLFVMDADDQLQPEEQTVGEAREGSITNAAACSAYFPYREGLLICI